MTDIENFYGTFTNFSKDYERAIAVGDHKKANRAHSLITALAENLEPSLRTSGLLQLLNDDIEIVRLWSTALLLKYDRSVTAKNVLNQIARSGSIHGLTAKAILALHYKQ